MRKRWSRSGAAFLPPINVDVINIPKYVSVTLQKNGTESNSCRGDALLFKRKHCEYEYLIAKSLKVNKEDNFDV